MPQSAVVLKLQNRTLDSTLVQQLQQLLQEAMTGELVGLAAVAHYGGPSYGYTGGGSLVESPELGVAASARLMQRFL